MARENVRPRLNLVMSERTKERLDRLAHITEADTSSEVIRNALRLYEVIINHVMNDKEFLIRNKKTGKIESYDPFLSVDVDDSRPVDRTTKVPLRPKVPTLG